MHTFISAPRPFKRSYPQVGQLHVLGVNIWLGVIHLRGYDLSCVFVVFGRVCVQQGGVIHGVGVKHCLKAYLATGSEV